MLPGQAGRLFLFGLVVGMIAAAGELPRVMEKGDEGDQVLVLLLGLGQTEGLGGDEDGVLPEEARLAVLLARELLLGVLDRPADALDETGRKGGQRAVEFLLFEKHGGLCPLIIATGSIDVKRASGIIFVRCGDLLRRSACRTREQISL